MTYQLLTGDVLDMLRALPSESVHCCVTSPPYWGLRDYGVTGQIGLEESLPEWVDRMVQVFAEVRRVLRHDGTLWLNLGDAYAGSWGAQSRGDDYPGGLTGGSTLSARQIKAHPKDTGTGSLKNTPGLKAKDLMGQPWRVAFALQEAGWYLRSDIVWSKPNPMPESITDRPTKSHEYLFLMAKGERYYYDNDAIREPYKPNTLTRRSSGDKSHVGDRRGSHQPAARNGVRPPNVAGRQDHGYVGANPAGRNRRSVWTITTARFSDAHFATFPEELVEPCILAGTSEGGCCAACGAPRRRVVERPESPAVAPSSIDRFGTGDAGTHRKIGGAYQAWLEANPSRTVGWKPTCVCEGAAVSPCTVLDCFSGSATTGAVALRLGRHYVGIELNPAYQEEIARPRLEAIAAQGQLRFHEVAR